MRKVRDQLGNIEDLASSLGVERFLQGFRVLGVWDLGFSGLGV